MPAVYNMHDAKSQLSKLAERAADGEEIVIARNGRPLAKLIAADEPRPNYKFGLLADKIWIADDFDAPLPTQIQRYFDGESDPEDPH
ncbi:MAG: type II toxin-antitoxin system Phd/YefM family antitoxin [Solirubrobacterales bacterium]|nr:type II toxin-antitoxin system Phd/YefM family antitoxin [Solirubrobacterales bacterium]